MAWNSPPRRSKYANTPTDYQGERYASKLEAARAAELDLLLAAGKIGDWRRGTRWTLLEPYVDPTGKRWRKVEYIPDFECWRVGRTRADGPPDFCEDTKGVLTAVFKIKQALMARVHPTIPLVVVTA